MCCLVGVVLFVWYVCVSYVAVVSLRATCRGRGVACACRRVSVTCRVGRYMVCGVLCDVVSGMRCVLRFIVVC